MREFLILAIHRPVTRRNPRFDCVRINKQIEVPYAPHSYSFIERLIGTVRREYLDRVFSRNAVDLMRKLGEFGDD